VDRNQCSDQGASGEVMNVILSRCHSAAAAVGVVGDAVAEGAVGVAFEGDDFVFCWRRWS
jgi:hypothetical protein